MAAAGEVSLLGGPVLSTACPETRTEALLGVAGPDHHGPCGGPDEAMPPLRGPTMCTDPAEQPPLELHLT